MKLTRSMIAGVVISQLLAFTQAIAGDNDGIITFNGVLSATSCKIDAGSQNTVNFGTYPLSQFGTADSSSLASDIVISLSGCPAGMTHANITFSASGDFDAGRQVFMNTVSTGATNIGVQILDQDKQPVVSGQKIVTVKGAEFNDGAGTATLPFSARLYSTGVTTAGTDGTISVPVNFTIDYQ
ncbi:MULTISPECIES: fimbrial protein [Enterobacterales]|uniref:fimbrial protein n=1 Tax=Enterobacterales TaxID=91347 RepID=UPI002ED9D69C